MNNGRSGDNVQQSTTAQYEVVEKPSRGLADFDFDLSDPRLFESGSWLKDWSYRYQEFTADFFRFFRQHPLIGYAFRRVVYGLITLLVAIVVLYILLRVVTDDSQYLPANYLNLHLNPDQVKTLEIQRMQEFGVYGPLLDQIGNYLRNLFPLIPKHVNISEQWGFNDQGQLELLSKVTKTVWINLGVVSSSSVATPGTQVSSIFASAIPYSFAFGSVAVVLSYLIGIPLGIEAAKRKGKARDTIFNGTSMLLVAVPPVVVVIGVYLISVAGLGSSSTFNSGAFATKFWPIIALMLLMMPTTIIMTRRYVVDEMSADYTKFAYSKGMSINRVYYVHIFRNAGIRILKQFPIDLAVTLFGASILTERQWNIPGMTQYIVNAVSGSKDFFVILGYVSFAAFIQIFSSLISDLLIVFMDPRVSLGKKS